MVLSPYNSYTVFREREKRSPFHMTYVATLQICFLAAREAAGLIIQLSVKSALILFETRSLLESEPHLCTWDWCILIRSLVRVSGEALERI